MPRVVVTGLGFISSIGNTQAEVMKSLREMRTGLELYPPFDRADVPVKVAGTVKGFKTDSSDPEDWTCPPEYKIRRELLRGFAPHGLYAHCAMVQGIEDAKLTPEQVASPETGLYTASAGSAFLLHHHVDRMRNQGIMRCSPMGVVSAIAGTLTFNLVANFKIQGASCGFVSACASSSHALGFAFDEIRLGRQKRMIVVGGEDGNFETILPFAGMRALTLNADPKKASRPFDKDRDGFVGSGGATVMVLEDADAAVERGAKVYAEMLGWGQSSDGHNVAISHPDGAGLCRAMENALKACKLQPKDVDYINAHATSTPIGDRSELRAIKKVFNGDARPAVSSTKALTGHGLSLAGALEAALTVLAISENFTPGSAHITTLDPEAEGVNVIRENLPHGPRIALSNSSGFGGANVALAFGRWNS